MLRHPNIRPYDQPNVGVLEIALAASTSLAVGGGGKDAVGREEDTLRESKRFEKCGAGWFGWEAPVVVVASISAC